MIAVEPARWKPLLTRAAVSRRALSEFLAHAKAVAGVDERISVLLTDDERIRGLNRNFRRKDAATDVLSFPADPEMQAGPKSRRVAGDLAVSLETAQRQAEAHGHDLEMELKILLLHGLLHLAGHDHEKDAGEMARLEKRLRRRLGLRAGLIQRSDRAGGRAASRTDSGAATAGARPARGARAAKAVRAAAAESGHGSGKR